MSSASCPLLAPISMMWNVDGVLWSSQILCIRCASMVPKQWPTLTLVKKSPVFPTFW